eukprot:GILJ01004864.1.p1 GENE.GILJ01004864.1~~GILJ01004864.1.p1  ORF type:complete len:673 (+),score=84.43 GILJ01004864.1:46-2019(+)
MAFRVVGVEGRWRHWGSLAVSLVRLAWPCSVMQFFRYVPLIINLRFAGRMGTEIMGGVALSIMWINITALAVSVGISSALETLCTQAYGAQNFRLLGVYLQRSCVIQSLFFIPIAVLWCFTDSILMALGQDALVCQIAGSYVRTMMFGLWPYQLVLSLVRFLNAQKVTIVPMVVNGVAAALHILWNYLAVDVFDLGFRGPAIATCLTYWLVMLSYVIYIRFTNVYSLTWTPWTLDCLRGWRQYLRLAAPGTVMIAAEWWAFELAAVMSGYLGTIQLDAFAALANTVSLWFMVPMGFATAMTTVVGIALGAGDPEGAKTAASVGLAVTAVYGLVSCLFYISIARLWGEFYSNEEEVISLVAKLIPVAALYSVSDAFSASFSGLMRAQGRPSVGAIGNTVVYYIVGLPCGYVFAMKGGLGALGLWLGLLLAQVLSLLAYLVLVLRADWNRLSIEAQNRSKESMAMGANMQFARLNTNEQETVERLSNGSNGFLTDFESDDEQDEAKEVYSVELTHLASTDNISIPKSHTPLSQFKPNRLSTPVRGSGHVKADVLLLSLQSIPKIQQITTEPTEEHAQFSSRSPSNHERNGYAPILCRLEPPPINSSLNRPALGPGPTQLADTVEHQFASGRVLEGSPTQALDTPTRKQFREESTINVFA